MHNGQYVDIGPPPSDIVLDDMPRGSSAVIPTFAVAHDITGDRAQKMQAHGAIPLNFQVDVPRELALLLEAWRQGTLADTILNRWYGSPSVVNKTHGEAYAGLRRNLLRICHADTYLDGRLTSIDPKGEIMRDLTSTLNYELGVLDRNIKNRRWSDQPLSKPLPGTEWGRMGGNHRKLGSVSKVTPKYSTFTLWEDHASAQPRVPLRRLHHRLPYLL